MTDQDTPVFNLKAVVRQTGLKPDTLRAWERRYGLPQPERSGGGHRLYSSRDIETIKWLMARQKEGLSIKRAVDLWQQIEADDRDPLETPTPITPVTAPAPSPRPVGESLIGFREAWITACLSYDEQVAEQVVTQAFALYTPETVVMDLLQKAVAEIGEGWYRGEVTVQQEHFASALAIRRLEALVMAAPPPTRPGRILAACPPQEEHVFGLLLLTFLLRWRGWEVVYLGANVPTQRLETTVTATHPQLVILGAQRLHSAATLLEVANLLQQEDVPLAYGGLIFNLLPDLCGRIPGHFLGERLDAAPRAVESLMTAPRPTPAAEVIPEAFLQVRDHFRRRESIIGAQLIRAHSSLGIPLHYISLANRELALNIEAALTLGNMAYLGADLDWVRGLLGNLQIPADTLKDYLAAYRQAVNDHLDEPGEPIVSWLGTVLQGNESNRS
jgi:DNA-binding transcriptional MerR regulator